MSAPRQRAFVLTPEPPALDRGGGPMRTASLLAYLEHHYTVESTGLELRPHSKSLLARAMRNASRLLRGTPPLFDRYSGYEDQLAAKLDADRYDLGVVEHFWCAGYAPQLRPRCVRLVLDLHNIESRLTASYAETLPGLLGWTNRRFAGMYRDLEKHWIPQFDTILVPSDDDRQRVFELTGHPDVRVFPNAIPLDPLPGNVAEQDAILFTGNLEYHPNVDAVSWFAREIWPRVRERNPNVEWRLAGRNPEAVAGIVSSDDSRFRVLGPMTDALHTLASAKIAIVPLRSGSGTRFKILEAWAAGRAVVSTSIGAEGLGAVSGEHLMIANDAASFADAITKLLNDSEERQRLGSAGRKLYEDRFTWEAAWRMLNQNFGEL